MTKPIISLIVARATNGVIGIENRLPWNLPADLKYFKAITSGNPIIMGKNTYLALGKPLPNRQNIVVSHGPKPVDVPESVYWAHSLEAALATPHPEETEVFIIGGANLFAQSWAFANRLYLTVVEQDFEGDTILPLLLEGFELTSSTKGVVDEKNSIPFHFEIWDRKR